MRLRELAEARRRFGYRRLQILLQREGWQVNHKRVYRLYVEEKLSLRRKCGRKRSHRAPAAAGGSSSQPGVALAYETSPREEARVCMIYGIPLPSVPSLIGTDPAKISRRIFLCYQRFLGMLMCDPRIGTSASIPSS